VQGADVRTPLRTIRPPSGFASLDLKELWAYRDLLTTLASRDILLRYRQTVLGVAWVLLQPLVGAGLLTFVFGSVAGLARGSGAGYFLLTFAGQVFYVSYAGTLNKASASLVGNVGLVSKVYFPRLILPLSTVASSLLDFAVGFCLLLLLLLVFHGLPGLPLLTLPFWLLFALLLSLGWGLIAAALMVAYRDVQHILPVLMQFLNFGSPVGWALERVGQKWLPIYLLLNPLAVLLEGFRWALFSKDGSGFPVPVGYVAYAAIASVGVFFVGTIVFRNRERRFADVI
jgi:lipopolysaccharide transport system permease protein